MADQTSRPFAIPAPPLVGRAREQAALREALAAALAGRGSLVLIGGEAGIGKTTLAEALLAEAGQRGALVLVGHCYDLSETPPYGPWAEALARTPPADGLPPSPDLLGGTGAASQATLFAQVRDGLAALAARRPVMLLLEDVHWADPASLDLLRVIARQLADLPLLLLATYRADELTRRHPLYQLLPTLEREGRAARLDLPRLDAPALRALVGRYALAEADAARLVAWLYTRAEGNAFFVAQLLRALEDAGALRAGQGGWVLGDLGVVGLPAPLQQVLDARVDRLGEDTRRLLALAAVIGQEVPLTLWAAVAETGEEALLDTIERATAARLLVSDPAGEVVRFAHALIREALYEGVLPARRRALHRTAAEALLATPGPDPDTVAHHLQRAGDPRAAGWLVAAGERAQAAWAYQSAAARYEAALALLEHGGGLAVGRAQLLARLARMDLYIDQARGIAYLDEAERLLRRAGDTTVLPHLIFARGALRGQAGDLRGALAELEAGAAGIAALGAAEHARLAPAWGFFNSVAGPDRAPAILVLWLASGGHLARARALGEQLVGRLGAARAAGGAGDVGLADASASLGLACALAGQPAAARQAFTRARAAADDDALRLVQAATEELRAVLLVYYPDRLAERLRLQDLADAAWARARAVADDADADFVRVWLDLVEGRWAAARRCLVAASATGPALWRGLLAAALGPLARAQGDRALAGATVRRWLPDGPATPPGEVFIYTALPLQQVAAGLALDAGDRAGARAWLAAHDRWLAWSGAERFRAEGTLGWAAFHRAAGDLALARQHAEAALARATEPRQPLALLAARRTLGELDTADGHHAAAAAHLDQALALAEACAAPYERALTLLALAELRAAIGDRDSARAALGQARALLEPLGARPALARADALAALLAAPVTPPSLSPALPAGLSAREAEVLGLVAHGLTNVQMAERLFLSRRTIDQHLRSIYAKLGVENRAAAAAFAVEHGLR